MSKIGNLIIGVGLNLKGLSKDLNNASYKLNAQAKKWKNAGKTLSTAFTLPLVAVGAAGVKMAIDLETNFEKVRNLVGVTGSDLEFLKNQVAGISGQTARGQRELSEALFAVTSAGIKGKDATDLLAQAAKASAIGLGNTRSIALASTAVLNAYGKETISAAKATDILGATIKFGNLEAESLAPVLGKVIGPAAQLGISFQEVGANIATFTRLGGSAENAVTTLSAVMNTFIKPTEQAKKALKDVGLSTQGVRDMIKKDGLADTLIFLTDTFDGNIEALGQVIPNVRALQNVLNTAAAQGSTYQEVVAGIGNELDFVNRGFENVSQTAGFKMKSAMTKLQNSAIKIGEILIPTVVKIADFVSALVDKFSNLSQSTKEWIVAIGLIVAAVGPVLVIIGTLLSSMGAIAGALSLSAAAIASFVSAVTGIGIAIAAVTAVTIVIKGLTSLTKEAGTAKDQLAESEREYTKQIKAERTEANKLFSVLESNTASVGSKKKAYEELLGIYPGILKNYSVEKTDLGQLAIAQDKVAESIKNRIRSEGIAKEKLAIIEKQIELEDELYKLEKNGLLNTIGSWGVIKENIKNTFREQKKGETQLSKYQDDLKDEIKLQNEKLDILDQQQALLNVTTNTPVVPPVTPDAPAGSPDAPDTPADTVLTEAQITAAKEAAAKDRADRLEAIRKGRINTIKEEQDEELNQLKLHYDKLIKDDLATDQDRIDLTDSYHEQREAMEESHQAALKDMSKNEFISGAAGSNPLDGLGAPVGFDLMFASISNNIEALAAYEQKLQDIKGVLSNFAEESVIGLADSFGSILENFNGFGDAAKRMGLSVLSAVGSTMQKLGKIIIVGSKAMETLRKYLESFGAIGAGASIAGGIALFALGKAISARVSNLGASGGGGNKIPKLAKGGVLYGETTFIGGEYSSASSNPEIVTPQNIMAETFRKVLGQNGAGGNGVGILHMDTIRFGLEKDNLRVT